MAFLLLMWNICTFYRGSTTSSFVYLHGQHCSSCSLGSSLRKQGLPEHKHCILKSGNADSQRGWVVCTLVWTEWRDNSCPRSDGTGSYKCYNIRKNNYSGFFHLTFWDQDCLSGNWNQRMQKQEEASWPPASSHPAVHLIRTYVATHVSPESPFFDADMSHFLLSLCFPHLPSFSWEPPPAHSMCWQQCPDTCF